MVTLKGQELYTTSISIFIGTERGGYGDAAPPSLRILYRIVIEILFGQLISPA